MTDEPDRSMEEVIRADGRYPPDAFGFLHEGLNQAVRQVYGEQGEPYQRHVSGPQLCEALRDLAIERWGMLARTVLASWGIRETVDFGNMVYLLVESRLMRKTDEDSLEDFRNVYDFAEAFPVTDEFEMKE